MQDKMTTQQTDVSVALMQRLPEIKKMVGLQADRLVQIIINAHYHPELRDCSVEGWIRFIMQMEETGLRRIGPGGAWAVPFRSKKTGQKEVVFIPDWRGLVSIAKEEGLIAHAYADVIRDGDEWEYVKGDSPRLNHKPLSTVAGRPVIASYAVFILAKGIKHIELMWREEIDKVAGCNRVPSEDSIWKNWPEEMAKKTVIKRGMKYFMFSNLSSDNSRLIKTCDIDNENMVIVSDDGIDQRARIAEPQPKKELKPIPELQPKKETIPVQESQPKKEIKPLPKPQPKKETATTQEQQEKRDKMIQEIIEIAQNMASMDVEAGIDSSVGEYLKNFSKFSTSEGGEKYVSTPEELKTVSYAWLQKIYANAKKAVEQENEW